jgi:hypothetical protein
VHDAKLNGGRPLRKCVAAAETTLTFSEWAKANSEIGAIREKYDGIFAPLFIVFFWLLAWLDQPLRREELGTKNKKTKEEINLETPVFL